MVNPQQTFFKRLQDNLMESNKEKPNKGEGKQRFREACSESSDLRPTGSIYTPVLMDFLLNSPQLIRLSC